MRGQVLGCVAAAVGVVLMAPSAAVAATGDVRIEVLSNRADLVSGGDALVQIDRPADAAAAPVAADVDGRDVTNAFSDAGGGRMTGLVTGLADGPNELTAALPDGRRARITITNHPIGGPVFSGPQVQPYVCNTQSPPDNSGTSPVVNPVGLGPPRDAQCNTPAAVSYVYKDASSGQFDTYDPSNPPAASSIAQTTTDQGKTVPYIVRQEFGVEDRGIYAIAVLADTRAWNHKLVTYFGASTAPDHLQSKPSAVLDDMSLSRGFMNANSSLNVNGENTNEDVSAEALMMLKEHIVETYGPIRYTIGEGCSGGSYQYMIASMYPGLLNGIQPNCSFTDLWTTAPDVIDCGLIMNYFAANPDQPWVPAIDGHKDPSDCASWDALFYNVEDPTNGSNNCKLDNSQVYDPAARPRAVRCTLQDYQAAIWGPRPRSEWGPVEKSIGQGFANRPLGNAGVQYGLQALQSGQITPAEFADLNAKIGGLDIDHKPTAARSAVDEDVAATAYRTSQVTDPRQLRTVPIIDLRAYSETGEIHTSFYSYKMRARLDRANGTHANQLIWTWPAAEPILGVAPPPDIALKSFLLMDGWLSRIEADRSDASLADKVLRDKPADATDKCFVGSGSADIAQPAGPPSNEIDDPSQCAMLYPYYGDTRTAAGAPVTDDVIQCRLKPLDLKDYAATFTDAEVAQLKSAFPDGVCDYSKPGLGQQPSQPWQTFADGPGGHALGPPPVSQPSGPALILGSSSRTCASRRLFRLRVRRPRHARIRTVTLYVNGHRVKRVGGDRSTTIVSLRGLPKGRVRVTVTLRAVRRGRRVTVRDHRYYRTCA